MAKTAIDTAVAKFPPAQRAALLSVRDSLVTLLPSATQEISWGMPTLKIEGIGLMSFNGFAKHNSMFPYSGEIVAFAESKGYEVTKGSIHFDLHTPMPIAILKQIVRMSIDSINASFPRKSGESKEFYSNGRLKASGKLKDGQMHGAWQWFRKDGTIMRSGSFSGGVQTGTWITHDSTGSVHKVTEFATTRRMSR
jgi:uncharacterized protein YdhG (YjbR/CyaY superfamily)